MPTSLFSHPFSDFSGNSGKITIATGPVIIDATGTKVLLHISASTGKYQFIGGRLDDSLSMRENALMRAREVLSDAEITLEWEPFILLDHFDRGDIREKILLVYYRAMLSDDGTIGSAQWFSLAEIESLTKNGQTSSQSAVITARHFLAV